jgi:polysaccharide pyruvyl transferase WcaK-like protein
MMDKSEYRLMKELEKEAVVIDNRPAAERIQSNAAQRRLAQMQKKREKDVRKAGLMPPAPAEASRGEE